MHLDFLRIPSLQVDWKPESPESYPEIVDLVKSIDCLKVEETKPQGSVLYFVF